MSRDDKVTRQNAFLKAYIEKKVIQDACEAVKLSRSTFESWKRNDPDFCEKFRMANSRISDDIKRMALKQAGILPWSEEEKSRGAHKWANVPALTKLMNQIQEFKDPSPTVNIVNFPVTGISEKEISSIVSPDAQMENKADDMPRIVQEVSKGAEKAVNEIAAEVEGEAKDK